MDGEALRGQTHTWTLDASYGITSWLTAEAVLPFVFKTQEVHLSAGNRRRSTGGLSDPMLLAKVTFWGHKALRPGALRLGVLGGVKIPLGDDEDTDDTDGTSPLPASFQASSGAVDLLAGAYYSVGLIDKSTLYGSVVFRITTTNAQDYRFGSTMSGTTDFRIAHLWPVTLAAGLRVTGAAADRDAGQQVDDSSGWQLAAHAGVGYFPWQRVFFNVDAIIPFWRGLEGHQMVSDASFVLGANVVF